MSERAGHYAKYELVGECAGCGARKWRDVTNPIREPAPKLCERCGKPFGEINAE